MKNLGVFCFAALFVYQINAQTLTEGGNNLTNASYQLSAILRGLLPQAHLSYNTDTGPYIRITTKYKEDEVIEKVLALIKQGVRIDSLKIIDFKKPPANLGNSTQIENGEFGSLVSVNEGRDGITLIQYCEAIECYKIANIFKDEITIINKSLEKSNK
jgi:hypothetical protein